MRDKKTFGSGLKRSWNGRDSRGATQAPLLVRREQRRWCNARIEADRQALRTGKKTQEGFKIAGARQAEMTVLHPYECDMQRRTRVSHNYHPDTAPHDCRWQLLAFTASLARSGKARA